ncbi:MULTISPECIES: FkbM family methyltransferase [unclassified Microcoleus]|uniref:FkbM family methyltransferase n=1 Tax=unclassified Microcoleus TaxID=2642155 RepID=UPI002FD091ED
MTTQISRNSMLESLLQLKQLGFRPKTVIDVGAALGTPPLYTAFPESRHFLIEPVVENEPYLAQLCNKLENAEYIIAAAARKSGSVSLQVSRHLVWSSMEDGSKTQQENFSVKNASWLREGELLRATQDSELRTVSAITLDEICKERRLSEPYLIKVDVDGAELDVLTGAIQILPETEYVIVEATIFEQMYEVINFMKSQGFIIYDMVDPHYQPSDAALSQIDVAFVKESGNYKKNSRYCATKEQEELLVKHLEVYRKVLISEIESLGKSISIKTEFELQNPDFWQQKAQDYLIQGNYGRAANLYEQAIESEPDTKSHYWHLGLILLLDGQEVEAQTTWLLGMAEGEPDQIEMWTAQLIEVLQAEAERRRLDLGDYGVAWAIRQHIREINPTDINNLLHLIGLSILLETYTGEEPISLGVIEALQAKPIVGVDSELLMQVLKSVLDSHPLHPSSLEFAEACLAHVQKPQVFIEIAITASVEIAHSALIPKLAVKFGELALSLDDKNLGILQQLAVFYQNAGQYDEGIEVAKLRYSLSNELPDKVFSNYQIMRGLMSAGGYWEEFSTVIKRHRSLLESLIAQQSTSLHPITVQNLFLTSFFFPYFQDDPKTNRPIQNQLSQLCQANVQIYAKEQAERYRQRQLSRKILGVAAKPLKIGYVSHCLRRHSVGWLARSLFQYHDRDRFQLYAYFMGSKKTQDSLQEWYVSQVFKAYKGGISGIEIAEEIDRDEIDILIDLDSITIDISCETMALKPAPVQVSWLGWDASGLPAIDYFVADPYVLPESAQDYYTEKIWRLPQTYIAVDGFDVGVPTLRRDQLNIPSYAVVYLSAQRGYKRHLDTARLQMKILKEVPNSYFLIKGAADEDSMKRFFNQLAEEEGVECDRLRFLPEVALEQVHRANLGIADVVLDTYPYNGATTTLETLWMGIPIVTRVGEQFAARNSYTMMMNAGVTEGIAWTDEEYVEWGIRLGKDATLRQQISWKMRQSRETAPLWNAQKFTREMENAYEQMWQRYIEGGN